MNYKRLSLNVIDPADLLLARSFTVSYDSRTHYQNAIYVQFDHLSSRRMEMSDC